MNQIGPLITPIMIHKDKKFPIKCSTAFVCFCPMPSFFEQQLSLEKSTERFFLHCHPCHVRFFNNPMNSENNVVIIAEVYGGVVITSMVEELHFYGIHRKKNEI